MQRNTQPALASSIVSYWGATPGFVDNATGQAGAPRESFSLPLGVATLPTGAIWPDFILADSGNNAIRRISAGGTWFSGRYYTFTLAGNGTVGSAGDGQPANQARFKTPSAVAIGPAPDYAIYVVDRGNNRVRKLICVTPNVCSTRSAFNPQTLACTTTTVGPTYADDGDPCTDDLCEVVTVRHRLVAAGSPCDDGNLCNGRETCDVNGACKPGTPLTPDDGQACTADSCQPVTGVVNALLAPGTSCATGNVCAPVSACNGSAACPAGQPISTEDFNDCTTDACASPGGVTHTAKAAGTACKTNVLSPANDGTCNSTGACIAGDAGVVPGATLDRTLPTQPKDLFGDFLSANGGNQSACVYTGSGSSCTLIPTHMALIRGTVADTNGTGLSGVEIKIVNHPEFGTAQSLSNGEYFMVVNGGAPLMVRATAPNYLRSDRRVNPTWGGTDVAQDIVLTALNGNKTTVTFASGGLASGTATSANAGGDVSKTRTAAAYFPANIAVAADGTSITSAPFRITEFTVGANGKDRMPANVADNTMYTYAAEFSLDKPDGSQYENVTLPGTTPVIAYVDNFIGVPAGETVPIGYYNRAAGKWELMTWQPTAGTDAPALGRVVSVDATGNVTPTPVQGVDPPLSAAEKTKLAASSYVGKSIWRIPLTHFSPLDFNLGVGAPPCEGTGASTKCPGPIGATAGGGDDDPDCGSCTKTGSIIDVERQVLREKFPVVGTPFSLTYSSENTLGYSWNKTLRINIENVPKPSTMEGIMLDFKVAGKRLINPPGELSPTGGVWPKDYEVVWDGRDHDGRVVQGAVTATLDIGAVYPASPRGVQSFGSGSRGRALISPSDLQGTRQNPKFIAWTTQYKKLQVWDASALGFGGWTLDVHHTFDPIGNVVYLGDGTHRKIENVAGGVVKVVGGSGIGNINNQYTISPDGTAIGSANMRKVSGMAIDRDGAIYLTFPDYHSVRKVSVVNGQYTTIADFAGRSAYNTTRSDASDAEAGVSAVGDYLTYPDHIAVHDDGRVVFGDWGSRRIYEVGLDGKLRTIAGKGSGGSAPAGCGTFVDGTPAKQFELCSPSSIATGPDGSVYYLDAKSNGSYVVRIDPKGLAWFFAGKFGESIGPTYYPDHNGAQADQLGFLASALSVDRSGTVWVSQGNDVIAIPQMGQVRTFRASFSATSGNGNIAQFPNGDLIIPSNGNVYHGYVFQRCTVEGKCTRIAGTDNGPNANPTPDAPAYGNVLQRLDAVAVAPDGSVFWAQPVDSMNGWKIFRVTVPPPTPTGVTACMYKIPSSDGSEYYCFDDQGQHRTTVDSHTNAVIRTFGYTSKLLTSITESNVSGTKPVTTIDRSVAGQITIKSPNLQPTTITLETTKNQYAKKISGDGTIEPTHDVNTGLLNSLKDADGQQHSFAYDKYGRLERDTDPAGGYQALSRVDSSYGYTVGVTTRMGKKDTYKREILDSGTEQRTTGLMNGLEVVSTRDLNGATATTMADGTVVKNTPGADPRWGMLAPFTASASYTAGSNTISMTGDRVLSADGHTLTDTLKVQGQGSQRQSTRVYTDSDNKVVVTSPGGRNTTYYLDALGRVKSIIPPGTQQIDFTINPTTGTIDTITQGTRAVGFTYSASGTNKGFLTKIDDAHDTSNGSPPQTVLTPDGNGRPSSSTHVGLATNLTWTASGRLDTVKPPRTPLQTHQLGYDARGLLSSYTPPTVTTSEATSYNFDLDRYLTGVEYAGTDDLVIENDTVAGRPNAVWVSGQKISYSYWPKSGTSGCTAGCGPGHLSKVVDGRSGMTTSINWIGSLPQSVDEGGTTTTWGYDNDLVVKSETFAYLPNHTSTTTFAYDGDGFLTCASLATCTTGNAAMVDIGRYTTSGRIQTIKIGTSAADTWTYNAYSELQSQDSTPMRIDYEDTSATPKARDSMGRVLRRKDRVGVGATTRTLNYTYDTQNRLWKVTDPAANIVEEYQYDSNGNRIYAKNSLALVDGTGANASNVQYDAQDRLTKYGTASFDYTPRGDLWHRTDATGTTTYDYDALGALRSVRLSDGRVIEYVLDGLGRRLGKMVNGTLVKQWRYGRGNAPIAEFDGTGTVRARFVHGSKPNTPDLIQTYPENKLYRVFSDQLGSPRLIWDLSAGVPVKAMDWDSFGNALPVSCPTCAGTVPQPLQDFVIGFAGGLYDADTKLTRFGARDYDASVGRWTSRDPILFRGRQTNLYVYVSNDPVNRTDPFGLEDGMGGAGATSGDGGEEGGPGTSPDDPAIACESEAIKCFNDCMDAQGADYAADAFMLALPFGPVPKTEEEMAKTLGGGASTTNLLSRLSARLGMPAKNGLRTAGKYASYVAAVVAAGTGGYAVGSAGVCMAECAW